MSRRNVWIGCLCAGFAFVTQARAQVYITEFMYDGAAGGQGLGEFVELTNRGASAVDMTGWTLDDSGDTAGNIAIGGFGMIAAGETVVIAQGSSAAAFRTAWGMPGTMKVIAYTTGQFNRNDTIIVRDSGSVVVTQLAYGDQTFPGTIRAQNKAGWPCAEVLGQSPITTSWNFAAIGDAQGSHASTSADLGSPGTYVHSFCGPPPTGACCTLGNCADGVTEDDCGDGSGLYQGNNSVCANVSCPIPAGGAMRITEYMYTGNGLEFIEFTNMDTHPINMAGWSYDDDSAIPGTLDLSAFGVVAQGQSVILSEAAAATFIADWNLSGVTVIGGSTVNLSRNDQINLFDNGGALVDRLSFGDQTFPGTIRTQNISGWPCADGIGTNMITKWYLSKVPDVQNSYLSDGGDVGNPGTFNVISCQFCGNGLVDGTEECDGGACCTQTCTYVAQSTECRAPAGICDVAEACDGLSSLCPPDIFAPIDTECRASTGDCDMAEFCSGTQPACPADAVAPNGTGCRGSAGPCDIAESCNGSGIDCPADAFSIGNECRASAGTCDIAELCDGTSADCPADVFANGSECRASAGVCDVAESCNGTSTDCPPDVLAAPGTSCRGAGGVCDAPESCDGQSVDCPADLFSTSGVCRSSTGPCDPAESCNGSTINCPPNSQISACIAGDGCCAPGCDAVEDPDCNSICGNLVVEPGEGCDDGNTDDGDGCSAICEVEFQPIPTVSQWGLTALGLLLLIGAKLQFGRRAIA